MTQPIIINEGIKQQEITIYDEKTSKERIKQLIKQGYQVKIQILPNGERIVWKKKWRT